MCCSISFLGSSYSQRRGLVGFAAVVASATTGESYLTLDKDHYTNTAIAPFNLQESFFPSPLLPLPFSLPPFILTQTHDYPSTTLHRRLPQRCSSRHIRLTFLKCQPLSSSCGISYHEQT